MTKWITIFGTMGMMKIGNTSLCHTGMRISHVALKRSPFPAPTGFRPGWQHPKTAVLSTVDVDSDTEDISAKSGDPAEVDWFNYVADDSEDDTKEASSMSTKQPTKNNGPSNVRSTNSILVGTNCWSCISSPASKLSSASRSHHLVIMSQNLTPPSAIPTCLWEPSNIGKESTFWHGTSISALSKIHGRLVICSQKHSISGMRYSPNTPKHLLQQGSLSSTW